MPGLGIRPPDQEEGSRLRKCAAGRVGASCEQSIECNSEPGNRRPHHTDVGRAAAYPRAPQLRPLVGWSHYRADRADQLCDEPEDAARDSRPGRTRRSLALVGGRAPRAKGASECRRSLARQECWRRRGGIGIGPDPHRACAHGSVVVRLENRQQFAGTRRVQQVGHARAPAGTADTPRKRDLQEKRDRWCPAVPARITPEPEW